MESSACESVSRSDSDSMLIVPSSLCVTSFSLPVSVALNSTMQQTHCTALLVAKNTFYNKKYVLSYSESVQCNFFSVLITWHSSSSKSAAVWRLVVLRWISQRTIRFFTFTFYKISSKSDDFSLRYGDITIFKMTAVRHLEFWKFSFLITWRSFSSKSAAVFQISWKSDDFSLRYGDISILKMAAVRHLGIVLPPYKTTHEVSVAGRSCLSNFMPIWYTDLKI